MKATTETEFDAEIIRASELCWETHDTDRALAILRPGVAAKHLSSYKSSIDWLQAAGRHAEARLLCERLLRDARGNNGAVALIGACEANVFLDYTPYDQDSISRGAFLRLAKQGNRTVQLELALNYLRGTKGFSRSDSEFEHWVRLAARDGHFSFDATCYYVDFLVSRGRRVHHVLVRKLEAESVKRPRWKELTALLKKARARQCNAAPLTRI